MTDVLIDLFPMAKTYCCINLSEIIQSTLMPNLRNIMFMIYK